MKRVARSLANSSRIFAGVEPGSFQFSTHVKQHVSLPSACSSFPLPALRKSYSSYPHGHTEVLPHLPTAVLSKRMLEQGVKRGYIVYDPNGSSLKVSHPVLQPLADLLARDKIDFDKHEAVFLQAEEDGVLLGVFLWRTVRGQGCGGLRLRHYGSIEDYVRDGLRLALGMGRKSALANLWWGGGKGVIANPLACSSSLHPELDHKRRKEILHSYGEFLSLLNGCYVAAEDSGITVADMNCVFEKTRFTTCISPERGGSGNPSVPTALGVVAGMEAACDFLVDKAGEKQKQTQAQSQQSTSARASSGERGGAEDYSPSSLAGKSVAIQGIGNVGGPLIGFLLEKGVGRIVASDVSPERVEKARAMYAQYKQVEIRLESASPELRAQSTERAAEVAAADRPIPSVLMEDVDIFSPCGFGGVLNEVTVPAIKAKIVCGAANNQLLDPATDYGMTEKGIVFVPDFLVNRMGIVNCANEQYGRVGVNVMDILRQRKSGNAMQSDAEHAPKSNSESETHSKQVLEDQERQKRQQWEEEVKDNAEVKTKILKDPILAAHLGREDPDSIYRMTLRVLQQAETQGLSSNEAAELIANQKAAVPHPIFGHRSAAIIQSLVEDEMLWAPMPKKAQEEDEDEDEQVRFGF